jgi:hypothetical protein
MSKSSYPKYMRPHPVSVLSELFRWWSYEHLYAPAMEKRLKYMIRIKVIVAYPPPPRGWRLRGENFNFSIKTSDDEGWRPAGAFHYRVLRTNRLLKGIEAAPNDAAAPSLSLPPKPDGTSEPPKAR